MLVASKRLVAAGVVALAHGSADNVDGGTVTLASHSPRRPNLGSLQLRRLALDLVNHHLAVDTEAAGRGRSVEVEAVEGRLRVTLHVEGLELVGLHGLLLLGEKGDGAVVGTGPGGGGVGHVGAREAVGGRHHEAARGHRGVRRDGVQGVQARGGDGAHGVLRGQVHVQHVVVVGRGHAIHLPQRRAGQTVGKGHLFGLGLDGTTHELGHVSAAVAAVTRRGRHVARVGGGKRVAGRVLKVERQLVGGRASRGGREGVVGRRGRREAGGGRGARHGLAAHAKAVVHVEPKVRLELHDGRLVDWVGMEGNEMERRAKRREKRSVDKLKERNLGLEQGIVICPTLMTKQRE